MRAHVVLTILGMAVVTYLTRAPLLLALSRRPPGPRLRLWLRLVPLAVLPALALPMVLVPQGRLALSWTSPEIWGAATVFACAAARLNLLLSVAAAVGVVALLRHLAA
jgi:branched-subunit amino acid transport protein